MAKPEVSKTELGQRLRSVRAHLGDPDREQFCLLLGISKQSLGNYERGDRIPDSAVLSSYRLALGVDLNWLATGIGDMFEDHAPSVMLQAMSRDSAIQRSFFAPDLEVIEAEAEADDSNDDYLYDNSDGMIDPDVMTDIGTAIREAYADVGTALPVDMGLSLAIHSYNSFVADGLDLRDGNEIEARIYLMKKRLLRHLRNAKSPGQAKAAKRTAS